VVAAHIPNYRDLHSSVRNENPLFFKQEIAIKLSPNVSRKIFLHAEVIASKGEKND
jgi:hypothetical protein